MNTNIYLTYLQLNFHAAYFKYLHNCLTSVHQQGIYTKVFTSTNLHIIAPIVYNTVQFANICYILY
ncbi:hypothetical protein NQ317_016244 [Molorchus minor]|uniref:Uncharacterized protein n=1 Tax=Molorchus minor TaxID=1323400 RepID=A0ABQ9JYS3_9CUCU|nr:hypothetical protein NQ317_016244 [Molorchus minor]